MDEPKIFDRWTSNEGFDLHPEPKYREDKKDKDGNIIIHRLGNLEKEYIIVFKTGKSIRISQSELNLKTLKASFKNIKFYAETYTPKFFSKNLEK